MFVFFGTRRMTDQIGQAVCACPNCRRETVHGLLRSKSWFTLFFIPMIPLGAAEDIARCNLCGLEGNNSAGSSLSALLGAALPGQTSGFAGSSLGLGIFSFVRLIGFPVVDSFVVLGLSRPPKIC